MKKCENCQYHLDDVNFSLLNSSPDGRSPYCVQCSRKSPWILRHMCRLCGSVRGLAKFPGLNFDAPCSVCSPPIEQMADNPLLSISLQTGTPKTVPELLALAGVHAPSRAQVIAATRYLRQQAYAETYRGATRLFAAGIGDAESDMLARLETCPPVLPAYATIEDIVDATGAIILSRRGILRAAMWLRRNNYQESRQNGRVVFRSGKTANDPTFRQWAETYHCADSLELPASQLEAFMGGQTPPAYLRYAMSALLGGLPAYPLAVK